MMTDAASLSASPLCWVATLTILGPLSSQSAQWQPVPELSDRLASAMAYDPLRQRVVLFGGLVDGSTVLSDTWEWDGERWQHRRPASRPPARWGHAMAFDRVRGTVLLFGGDDFNRVFDDTWEWDGVDWRRVSTGAGPTARTFSPMASDPARGCIVLFGGIDGVPIILGRTLQDTWEWDGVQWAQASPATVPELRRGHALAYNGLTGRVCMAGGSRGMRVVWEWNGLDWTRIVAPDPTPGPLGAMTADPIRGGVLAHGKVSGMAETWRWDGQRWTQLAPSAFTPPARSSPLLAADLARGVIVLAGAERTDHNGFFGRRPGRDTWTLDPRTDQWRLAQLWPKPPGDLYQIVFDASRRHFLIVGPERTWRYTAEQGFQELKPQQQPPRFVGNPGSNWSIAYHAASGFTMAKDADDLIGGIPDVRTWVWDGTNWRGWSDPVRPPPDLALRMTYDPARQTVLALLARRKELWAWDPSGWSRLAAAELRLPDVCAMAVDAVRGRLVVHGVDANDRSQTDTWEWDGGSWVRMRPATPAPRGRTMVYVPELAGCLLVSVDGNDRERREHFWLWNGTDWRRLPIPPLPTAFGFDVTRSLVYDPSRRRVLSMHEFTDNGSLPESMWQLRFERLRVDRVEPRVGGSATFAASFAGEAGKPWILALALSSGAGIPIRPSSLFGMEVLPLDDDPLLRASLSAGLGGVLDSAGSGRLTLQIPADPCLAWLEVHAAAFTHSPAVPSIDTISNRVGLLVIP